MSVTSSYGSSPSSPRVSVGLGSCSTRALAVVTNKWYREQRRAEQEVTRSLTLLKQRKISCILKAESLHRGLVPESGPGQEQRLREELEEVERKMQELKLEGEERCRKIMHRRVQQVNTLQELGLLEAVGKESMRSRSEGESRDQSGDLRRSSPAFTSSKYSPASSSSSHTSRRFTPPLNSRTASENGRPDPGLRLEARGHAGRDKILEDRSGVNKGHKLSPRIGRRNPLRMLSDAIDFRSRRKQRPKSADFEIVDETDGDRPSARERRDKAVLEPPRSASVTDLLESVTISKKERVLEGRNSAPDIIPNAKLSETSKERVTRTRPINCSATKQKLSTRFQPQRKPAHRITHSNSVRRAKTFNHGGGGVAAALAVAESAKQSRERGGYTTLPKQSTASSRSLVSSSSSNEGSASTDSGQGTPSSTDSGQGTPSTDTCSTASRKSSNSSYTSTASSPPSTNTGGDLTCVQISQSALDEIAKFEKFIEEYFENVDNNNVSDDQRPGKGKGTHKKVSSTTALAEILELSI